MSGMRFSPPLLAFLGRMEKTFRKGNIALAEGIFLATLRPGGVVLAVVDSEIAPSFGLTLNPDALRIFGGLKRAELILAPDHAELVQGSKGFKLPVEAAEGPPVGLEGWETFHAIQDPAAFREALAGCLQVASKDPHRPNLARVALSQGEALATDGHRLAIHYAGVDGEADVPRELAEAWLKMLISFDKGQGSWWLKLAPGRCALALRQAGREITLAGDQTGRPGGDPIKPSPEAMRAYRHKDTPTVSLAPETKILAGIFDFLAIYANGEVVGWMQDDSCNNGNTGPIPTGGPLVVVNASLLRPLLPKGRFAHAITVGLAEPKGVSNSPHPYGAITVGDNVLMGSTYAPPCLPEDCYLPATTEAAA